MPPESRPTADPFRQADDSEIEALARLARADSAVSNLRRARRALITGAALTAVFPWLQSMVSNTLVSNTLVSNTLVSNTLASNTLVSRALHAGVSLWGALSLAALCACAEEWRLARERTRAVARLSASARDRLAE